MADQPSNVHLQLAGTDRLVTADGYGKQHILGNDRALIPVSLSVTGIGSANGPVAPAGVRLALVGVGVDWPAPPGANVAAVVDVALGGNGVMGTTDQTLGLFTAVTPTVRVPTGTAPGTIFFSGLRIVTSASDGSTVAVRARVTAAGAADVVNFYLLMYPVNAEDVPCPT